MVEKYVRYRPPWSLRNGHVQSLLGSSGLRRKAVAKRAEPLQAAAEGWTLDGGDGIRLQGLYSPRPDGSRGLAVLLHGWEGNVNSNYILGNGARLFAAGFDVFRLNFRDHGDTHHLNHELFHSCRLDEVVHALRDLQDRLHARQWRLAGYSLGGNFSMRVGLKAEQAGAHPGYNHRQNEIAADAGHYQPPVETTRVDQAPQVHCLRLSPGSATVAFSTAPSTICP